MFELRPLIIAFTLFALFCCKAQASSFEASTEQVKAQLVASVDAVHPGDEILVGVHQRIIPHWHTYWRNPGDSGLATTIAYELPIGAKAGKIQWPTPSRITLGPVTSYGYEHEVTLLTKIKVPQDSVAGSVFPIKAKVKWLVCEESCIPQKVELALDLPIVLPGADAGTGSPLIDLARASLPVASPWPISLAYSKDVLSLRMTDAKLQSSGVKKIWFYPDEWGKIAHGAEQPWQISGDNLELQMKPGDVRLSPGESLAGVLAITQDSGSGPVTRGYSVQVAGDAAVSEITALKSVVSGIAPVTAGEPDLALASALLLALLGGMILNLMPCVLPVLSIKALALIKHAQHAPLQTRLHGLAYTLGILASFALLGGVLIALKAGGAQIGWGFQFQSPVFVLAVAYLMFTVGLSLSGVFSIGGSVAGIGSSLAERPGYRGSFFTGVLATIVATPCTAPFMGAALGFALTQPPASLLAVFFCLGLGLALPYLLLSQWPSLQRRLPKPGVWMDRLKQGLAFPMYGAAVWLVWVLAQQAGVNAVAIALGGMVIIAFAAWLYEFTKMAGKAGQRSGFGLAALSLGLALVGGYFGVETTAASPSVNVEPVKNAEPYSAERLNELRSQGKPVFLNMTAAWCISCLVNEKVALSQSSIVDMFKRSGITYLKGDWTNRDPEITRILTEFGRSGVPLYVFYPAGAANTTKPIVLPQILTPEIVTRAVTL
jgi:thiol:disulfide interchange protein/DsbC/DsbD-like thiol-disulfide interchange protein